MNLILSGNQTLHQTRGDSDIHQIRDGKIVTTWHLEDFAGLMAQLNAPANAPTPPAWG